MATEKAIKVRSAIGTWYEITPDPVSGFVGIKYLFDKDGYLDMKISKEDWKEIVEFIQKNIE